MSSGLCTPTGAFSTIINHAFQSLLIYQCSLVDQKNWPPDKSDTIAEGCNDYDYIVIGCGSSGSVIINRLSENPSLKILAVESGTNPIADVNVPGLSSTLINSNVDWSQDAEPDPRVCLGSIGGTCHLTNSKIMGGSGSTNDMTYVRGTNKDFDCWESNGNCDWGYSTVINFFKMSENAEDADLCSKYHGRGGLWNVALFNFTHPLHPDIMAAGKELGHPINNDINGEDQYGFTKLYGNVKNGVRCSSANAFIQTAKDRCNVHFIKMANVNKIIFDNKQAVGVNLKLENNVEKNVYCKKEIILASGAINSAKLLLLSGIGPASHLNDLGIPIVADLSVGENLHDHTPAVVTFTSPPCADRGTTKELFNIGNYVDNKSGPFARGADTAAFIKTEKCSTVPDVQFTFNFIDTVNYPITDLQKFKYDQPLLTAFSKLTKYKDLMYVTVSPLKPKSRGKLTLRSCDPSDPPIIRGNFLSHPDDMKTMLKGIDELVKMQDTCAFKRNKIVLERLDYSPCNCYPFKSVDYWTCIIQHTAVPSGNMVGTVKMGPKSDPTAVVDEKLCVHGIKGLRVADSSIIPVITSGNTNAVSVMIAEKGAAMILEDCKKKNKREK